MEAPIPGAKGLYMDMEALLSLKGAKLDAGGLEAKLKPYYLEIPVHLGYKYEANEDFSVFGNAGPYMAIGLFGKMDGEVASVASGSVNIFGDDVFKRFDFGLGLKAGIEIKKTVQVVLGYDLGLIDVVKDNDGEGVQNRNFSISLAYLF